MVIRRLLVLLLAAFVLGTVPGLYSHAATPAGTYIRNQASASFLDGSGQRVSVTSNLVETLVQQVGGFELSDDNTRRASPGETVQYSHRIVNTGNGSDSFSITAVNLAGDNIDLDAINIYPDVDRNGVADSTVAITQTPAIGGGGSFDFVVVATVPSTATDGSVGSLELTAVSAFDSTLVDTDTDTVIVGSGATIAVIKSMSTTVGSSPGGPWQVTLDYLNTGTESAGDLVIIDALPAGMTYVPGSGTWSGSAETLTDASATDTHVGASSTLIWCAYDPSCAGLPEAELDSDEYSSNQVTAIINFLPPGSGGQLKFDVVIDAELPPSSLINQAEFEYDVAIGTVPREFGNPAVFTVLPTYSVVANGSATSSADLQDEPVTVALAPAGGAVQFENIVWNTGTGVDSYNIDVDESTSSFPANTLWRLLRADGATPMLDTNGDGQIDTGPINPGEFSTVVLEVTLPADAAGDNDGSGFDITKTARSIGDSTVFNAVRDHLDEIVPAAVDLTNQAAAGSATALGVGPGPEPDPVSTTSLDADGSARFDLFVAHAGELPTRYQLSASLEESGDALPSGWSVDFEDPTTGDAAFVTAPLVSGAPAHVVAVVTPPADHPAATESIWFTAMSEDGATSDIKHDAVLIGASSILRLHPHLNAQLEPGQSVVYVHQLVNEGNAALSDITLSSSETLAGWATSLWIDVDGDSALSAADIPWTDPQLLDAGAAMTILARVEAPTTAGLSVTNQTTIVVAWDGGSQTDSVVDNTTTSDTHVSIVKTQAIDLGCDGAPDPGESFSPSIIEIEPGNNCVIYRLEATNTGNQVSYNVSILDYTPEWTVYSPGATCSRSPCWMTTPASGSVGSLSALTDELAPGESYSLEFSVRVP